MNRETHETPLLRLSPASGRGWFGGVSLFADDVRDVAEAVSLAQAAEALEAAFTAEEPCVTAVLARYGGECTVVRFGAPRVDAGSVATAPAAGTGAAEPVGAAAPAAALPPAAQLLRDAGWDLTGREYRAAVAESRERIAAGDVYVLNLTARLEGELAVPGPEAAFATLESRAGADMAALLTGLPGEIPWIASVSPERFVSVSLGEHGARVAQICPIKGTAPRGSTPEADAALAAALAADPKERAEHVMVVDLERNDLGVVCAPGTVHVDPLYEVVPTPYCHQLVSTVRGALRADASFADLLTATFPCGSITGAPKRAAMRIIGELEASERRAYCGALLVAMPGRLDSSVLIRTLEGSAQQPGHARWGAGCGITHDSDPAAEHLEMLLKATPVTGDAPPAAALRETMRVVYGRVPLLDRHLARLASGGAGPSVLARVRSAVAEQLASADQEAPYARLGITVTPDGEVAAGLTETPSSLDVDGGPVLVPVEIAALPALPAGAAKPAARRFWDRAHHGAELAHAHQAALHLPDGTLVDGSTASIWLVRDGVLLTPPAPPAIAGVCRELVFDVASQLGIPARAARLTLADLEDADEVALSNAVGLFVAVRGRGGAVSADIAHAIARRFAER